MREGTPNAQVDRPQMAPRRRLDSLDHIQMDLDEYDGHSAEEAQSWLCSSTELDYKTAETSFEDISAVRRNSYGCPLVSPRQLPSKPSAIPTLSPRGTFTRAAETPTLSARAIPEEPVSALDLGAPARALRNVQSSHSTRPPAAPRSAEQQPSARSELHMFDTFVSDLSPSSPSTPRGSAATDSVMASVEEQLRHTLEANYAKSPTQQPESVRRASPTTASSTRPEFVPPLALTKPISMYAEPHLRETMQAEAFYGQQPLPQHGSPPMQSPSGVASCDTMRAQHSRQGSWPPIGLLDPSGMDMPIPQPHNSSGGAYLQSNTLYGSRSPCMLSPRAGLSLRDLHSPQAGYMHGYPAPPTANPYVAYPAGFTPLAPSPCVAESAGDTNQMFRCLMANVNHLVNAIHTKKASEQEQQEDLHYLRHMVTHAMPATYSGSSSPVQGSASPGYGSGSPRYAPPMRSGHVQQDVAVSAGLSPWQQSVPSTPMTTPRSHYYGGVGAQRMAEIASCHARGESLDINANQLSAELQKLLLESASMCHESSLELGEGLPMSDHTGCLDHSSVANSQWSGAATPDVTVASMAPSPFILDESRVSECGDSQAYYGAGESYEPFSDAEEQAEYSSFSRAQKQEQLNDDSVDSLSAASEGTVVVRNSIESFSSLHQHVQSSGELSPPTAPRHTNFRAPSLIDMPDVDILSEYHGRAQGETSHLGVFSEELDKVISFLGSGDHTHQLKELSGIQTRIDTIIDSFHGEEVSDLPYSQESLEGLGARHFQLEQDTLDMKPSEEVCISVDVSDVAMAAMDSHECNRREDSTNSSAGDDRPASLASNARNSKNQQGCLLRFLSCSCAAPPAVEC